MDTPTVITIATILIITTAFFGESVFGFAGGLIAVPLLSLFLGVKDAVTLTLLFQLCMGLLLWKAHTHIERKHVFATTIAIAVGSVIGTYSLAVIDEQVLRKILAITIVAFLIRSTFFSYIKLHFLHQKHWAIPITALGGWVQGILGTAGPVFVMYLHEITSKKTVLRATMIFFLFVSNVVRIPSSIFTKLLSVDTLEQAAWCFPFFLVAIAIGQRLHHHISELQYKRFVNVILFISAITLLMKN